MRKKQPQPCVNNFKAHPHVWNFQRYNLSPGISGTFFTLTFLFTSIAMNEVKVFHTMSV